MTRYAERTDVPSDRSRAEIERTLRRYGASAFGYGWDQESAQIMFQIAGRRIAFKLPMPDPQDAEFRLTPTGKARAASAQEQAYEQAVKQRWRALALVIKAKLEAVEAGIATLEEEFLAHIVLPDGRTVGQHAIPRIAEAYDSGAVPALMSGTAFGGQ